MATDDAGATTYYDLLGLRYDASEAEIKAAFQAKMRELRRSKAGMDQLELMEEGYSVLMDPASREEYDNRLQSLALFQEFEAREPEWIAGYHVQLNNLTDAENEAIEPQLDEIFAQLSTKNSEAVKQEVQRLFARVRSERCKEQLRVQLLPQVRLLPKELQKGTLAHILDMFGDLAMSDADVFRAGMQTVHDILYPPPPSEAKEAKKKKKKKDTADPVPEGDQEAAAKKKKKKKAIDDTVSPSDDVAETSTPPLATTSVAVSSTALNPQLHISAPASPVPADVVATPAPEPISLKKKKKKKADKADEEEEEESATPRVPSVVQDTRSVPASEGSSLRPQEPPITRTPEAAGALVAPPTATVPTLPKAQEDKSYVPAPVQTPPPKDVNEAKTSQITNNPIIQAPSSSRKASIPSQEKERTANASKQKPPEADLQNATKPEEKKSTTSAQPHDHPQSNPPSAPPAAAPTSANVSTRRRSIAPAERTSMDAENKSAERKASVASNAADCTAIVPATLGAGMTPKSVSESKDASPSQSTNLSPPATTPSPLPSSMPTHVSAAETTRRPSTDRRKSVSEKSPLGPEALSTRPSLSPSDVISSVVAPAPTDAPDSEEDEETEEEEQSDDGVSPPGVPVGASKDLLIQTGPAVVSAPEPQPVVQAKQESPAMQMHARHPSAAVTPLVIGPDDVPAHLSIPSALTPTMSATSSSVPTQSATVAEPDKVSTIADEVQQLQAQLQVAHATIADEQKTTEMAKQALVAEQRARQEVEHALQQIQQAKAEAEGRTQAITQTLAGQWEANEAQWIQRWADQAIYTSETMAQAMQHAHGEILKSRTLLLEVQSDMTEQEALKSALAAHQSAWIRGIQSFEELERVARQDIWWDWLAADRAALAETHRDLLVLLSTSDMSILQLENRHLRLQLDELRSECAAAHAATHEGSEQAQEAYRKMQALLEEMAMLRAQLKVISPRATPEEAARELAERREREARLDLEHANQVIRKREAELEEARRALAALRSEDDVNKERLAALQANLETLFGQLRTTERAHARELQELADRHAQVVEELRRDRQHAFADFQQQRQRTQELEVKLDAVMNRQHTVRIEAEERVRDGENAHATQMTELRKLQGLYKELEALATRTRAQNGVLLAETEALRAKESDLREIIRMEEEKGRQAEDQVRELRRVLAAAETIATQAKACKQVLEEELHQTRERHMADKANWEKEKAAWGTRFAGVEEILAQTRAAQRRAEAEAEQAWLQWKAAQNHNEERLEGEMADHLTETATARLLQHWQAERQGERLAALEQQLEAAQRRSGERGAQLEQLQIVVEDQRLALQTASTDAQRSHQEADALQAAVRGLEREILDKSQQLRQVQTECETWKLKCDSLQAIADRHHERELALEQEQVRISTLHTDQRVLLEQEVAQLRAHCRELEGAAAWQTGAAAIAQQEKFVRAQEIEDLQRQLVEAEVSQRQMKAKYLAGNALTGQSAGWVEEFQRLEMDHGELLCKLQDAIVEQVIAQCHAKVSALEMAEYCAIAADQHSELDRWHRRYRYFARLPSVTLHHCALLMAACTIRSLAPFVLSCICIPSRSKRNPWDTQRLDAKLLSLKGLIDRPAESSRAQSARVISLTSANTVGWNETLLGAGGRGTGRTWTHTQERIQEHIRRSRHHSVEFDRLYTTLNQQLSQSSTSTIPKPR